jgi:hypothetical protein
VYTEPYAIEAICDVNLEEANGAEPGVAVDHLSYETFESASKLHGLGRGQGYGILIDTGVGVIHYGTGPAFVLRDDSHGGDAQIAQVSQAMVWKDYPGGPVDHVGHFIA